MQMSPILKALKDYDAQIDVVEAEIAGADEVRLAWHKEVIATRISIRDLMTREEWDYVFGVQ